MVKYAESGNRKGQLGVNYEVLVIHINPAVVADQVVIDHGSQVAEKTLTMIIEILLKILQFSTRLNDLIFEHFYPINKPESRTLLMGQNIRCVICVMCHIK